MAQSAVEKRINKKCIFHFLRGIYGQQNGVYEFFGKSEKSIRGMSRVSSTKIVKKFRLVYFGHNFFFE